MEPIIAVMLMLGCDDAMMVCRETTEPVRQYATVENCEADIEFRVREIDNFPVAVAECLKVPGLRDGQSVAIDWRIDRTGGLYAEAEAAETGPRIASGELQMASAERFQF
jgi:hypothetical protein